MNTSTQKTVDGVNQLIATLPADDAFPADGFESIKSNYKKLTSGLKEIKMQSDKDIKYPSLDLLSHKRRLMTFDFRAIEEVQEKLDVLVAMRRASESTPQGTQGLHRFIH